MSTQLEVAKLLKFDGASSIADLADSLGISYEAVRVVVDRMEREGVVESRLGEGTRTRGRPKQLWTLTIRGEHLFPKKYDALSDTLLRTLGQGPLNGQRELLEELATVKTEELATRFHGASEDSRLSAVQQIYSEEDDFISVERKDGGLRIVEHNCPYLNVAVAHPGICAVTTNVMGNVLGRKVVRTETFQAGDGRCVFAVLDEAPSLTFTPED